MDMLHIITQHGSPGWLARASSNWYPLSTKPGKAELRMTSNRRLGNEGRWWSWIRTPMTAGFNAEQVHSYYAAYGWAQGRLNTNTTAIRHHIVEDIASFYDNQRTDDAWEWYRINYLIHTPFSVMAPWEAVANRINDVLQEPTLVPEIPQYIGLRLDGSQAQTTWCKVGHTSHFILRLLYARIQWEEQQKKSKKAANPQANGNAQADPADDKKNDEDGEEDGEEEGKDGPYMHWRRVDLWAAAHILYHMLSRFQNEYAQGFRDQYPRNYLKEYLSAESTGGGVNPLVLPPAKMTPQQYQQHLTDNASSWIGRVGAYFRAMP